MNAATPPQAAVTVVILTFNEARHLARAIDSVRAIAAEVLVVDSLSTDDTVAIARAAGARVLTNPFVNYSQQSRWALDHGEIATPWVLRLDADEVIEADLQAEIARRLPVLPPTTVGVAFRRKHIFMGRWIRHGGRYPLVMIRLWRIGYGEVEDRWMDEHVVTWGGDTVVFDGGFADINLNDLSFFTAKHNDYATREAIDVLSARYGLVEADRDRPDAVAPRQAGVKRWVKERVYNRLPFWVGPLGYFLYRYVAQAGFLDGRAGLIYHGLQGGWYRFLVNAKVIEFDQAMADCTTTDARRARLSALTRRQV